ncbi:hypothetical protein GCM10022213_06450 [Parerythrobacter jejuensis]
MRIFSAVLLFSLAACSQSDPVDEMAAAQGDQMLSCAIGPGTDFTESCTLQKFEREGETVFRVNHPRGGFRLFNLAGDGTGLIPHDGAEGAVNRLDGDVLEVTVGVDRYRFPAAANAGEDAQ